MPDNTELLRTIERIQKELKDLQDKKMVDLATTFRAGTERFDSDIQLISEKIAGGISKAELRKLPEYKRLVLETNRALNDYAGYLSYDIRKEASQFVQYGNRDAETLMRLSSGDVAAMFRQLSPEQLAALGNYINPGRPLYNRLQMLSETTVNGITQTMFDMIAGGYNPKQIARNITNAYGVGLTDSMRMMRTAQIYSYRDATAANYQANSDVVKGWIWTAKLDSATCFPMGTLVRTQNGYKPIEEIKTGDLVVTHTGKLKHVTQTMKKEYSSGFVELEILGNKITSTYDHPYLVGRNGLFDWIYAKEITTNDTVVIDKDFFFQKRNHIFGKFSIKICIFNSIYRMSFRRHPSIFSGVTFFDGFATVPVNSVNLYNGAYRRQEKINRVSPSWKTMFLNVFNTNAFETHPNIFFRLCLSNVSSVASWATKFLSRQSRNYSKIFPARKTLVYNWRSSTCFRTVASVFGSIKNNSASFASFVNGVFRLTRFTTNIVPVCVGLWNSKRLVANRAYLRNLSTFSRTISRTKISRPFPWIKKFFSACFTNSKNTLALCGVVTLYRTKFSISSSTPCFWNFKGFSTLGTRFYNHNSIISSFANHVQKEEVYNIEVEDDHSYIANGVVVHNCMSCVAQHGTLYKVDERLKDHFNGRCVPVPLTILNPEPFIKEGAGQEWFEKQPESVQRQMMGEGRYQAWKDGKFKFGQLSAGREDPVYGIMQQERSLKDLLNK
jgi:hypothetical protein